MGKVHVEAKRDFLESSLTPARPIVAIGELVWNGFDAGADLVQVNLDINRMDGIESIRVLDNGSGIPNDQLPSYFGSLGDSWKKTTGRLYDRALHGKNGKGRFRAFALGTVIEWKTTYESTGKRFTYSIRGSILTLDDFDTTDPVETPKAQLGTEVTISNIRGNFQSLREDSSANEITKVFAAYLTEYPNLKLDYNGIRIDPRTAQTHTGSYDLGEVEISGGKKTPVSVSIIEWSTPTERAIHLCDAKGISLSTVQAGQQIRAPGYEFTAYIKADHFRELDKDGKLLLDELDPDVKLIVAASKAKIKEHFRRRSVEDKGHIVARWKAEQIYPYEEKEKLDPVEEAERQVFDILAVNVESYLPSFEDSDAKTKRFTFRLLAQAVRENPDSVQKIISEVLGLKKEEQDDLAGLLAKTTLSSIINLAKVVSDRLNFLIGLQDLVFSSATKKTLLERDQLHRILENEAWLFHEEFALAASEVRLEEALNEHLGLLGQRQDDPEPVEVGDGKTGRLDLMLSKVTQPRTGEFDYLVVELKRPSRKIDSDVLTQVEKYAMAIAKDPRFHGVPTKWTFIAVSNEMDEYAQSKASQRDRPRGQVHNDAIRNITVWAKTWSEVINDARARLQFVNKQLEYEADRDSARSYLKKTHEKFIPTKVQPEVDAKPAAGEPAEASRVVHYEGEVLGSKPVPGEEQAEPPPPPEQI
jgi:hypothetical protein